MRLVTEASPLSAVSLWYLNIPEPIAPTPRVLPRVARGAHGGSGLPGRHAGHLPTKAVITLMELRVLQAAGPKFLRTDDLPPSPASAVTSVLTAFREDKCRDAAGNAC